jgi:hypothetical protein
VLGVPPGFATALAGRGLGRSVKDLSPLTRANRPAILGAARGFCCAVGARNSGGLFGCGRCCLAPAGNSLEAHPQRTCLRQRGSCSIGESIAQGRASVKPRGHGRRPARARGTVGDRPEPGARSETGQSQGHGRRPARARGTVGDRPEPGARSETGQSQEHGRRPARARGTVGDRPEPGARSETGQSQEHGRRPARARSFPPLQSNSILRLRMATLCARPMPIISVNSELPP